MAYKQIRAFDTSKAGDIHGMCEQNVRLGYVIGSKYDCAWQNWINTDQHTGTPPSGVATPVFFWYLDEDNGHVGVQLPNGKFWSDGVEYDSIAAYEADHDPVCKGWSTHMDGVQVIEEVADPVPAPKPSSLVGKSINLPADSGTWHLYYPNGPYSVALGKWITILHPSTSSAGYTYPIVADKGNGVYVIKSPRWGLGALYTKGSKFTIK